MSEEWLGIVSLVILFSAIFIGFPIAFTLIAVALGVGYVALGPIALHLMTIQFFSVMKETSLASVPFFLFMGYLLEQSGLMERLFRGIQQLLAGVKGSLYIAVLVTATIFAAATGIVGSSVTLLGVMAAPSMKKSGYDVRLSAGAITAGGTLGILIPPSVMLIVMGPVVGVPTTDLFAAAVIPGLMLAGLYIVYCVARSYIDPSLGPADTGRRTAGLRCRRPEGTDARRPAGRHRHHGNAGRDPRRHRHPNRRRRLRSVRRVSDDHRVRHDDLAEAQEVRSTPPWKCRA